MALARGWTALLTEGGSRRARSAAFYTSLLGRYIPGMVWQPLAQVGLATRAGATVERASVGFVVFAIAELAAGGVVASTLLLTGTGLPAWFRAACGLLLLSVILLRRGWMVRCLGLASRVLRRPLPVELIPSDSGIRAATVGAALAIVLNGIGFALLLHSADPSVPFVMAISAFGFAWTVGFVAIPVPAGLGIREAALILALSPVAPTSSVIAASVTHRLLSIVSEGLVIAASNASASRARRAGVDRPAGLELDRDADEELGG